MTDEWNFVVFYDRTENAIIRFLVLYSPHRTGFALRDRLFVVSHHVVHSELVNGKSVKSNNTACRSVSSTLASISLPNDEVFDPHTTLCRIHFHFPVVSVKRQPGLPGADSLLGSITVTNYSWENDSRFKQFQPHIYWEFKMQNHISLISFSKQTFWR